MSIANLNLTISGDKIFDKETKKPIIFTNIEIAKKVIDNFKKSANFNQEVGSKSVDHNDIKYYVYADADVDGKQEIHQYNIYHKNILMNMYRHHGDVSKDDITEYQPYKPYENRHLGGATITSLTSSEFESSNSTESECNYIMKLKQKLVPNQELQEIFNKIKMYSKEDCTEYLKDNSNIIVDYINNNKDILYIYLLINDDEKLKEFLLLFDSIINVKDLLNKSMKN
jgi:hypothetical protein